MACEQFLELMETEALAIEQLQMEASQIELQIQARMGTLYGYYMQYMMCMNGQAQQPLPMKEALMNVPSSSELLKIAKGKRG